MKRILVLNYEFPPLGGGASPVSFEIAKKLSETGDFDIDVVTMGFKDLPSYEKINKNLRIHRVKCWRSKKEICHPWEQATYLVSGWFKCKKLLKKNKYDLCHCHFIIPTGILALRLKKKFGLPYIITSHGSDVLGYNARFKLLYPFLIRSWKKILDNARKVITPSQFLQKEILKVYPTIEKEKMVVIPNGIEEGKFKPMKKEKYILLVSRLFVNKGIQDFIEAIKDVNLGEWHVKIVGEGPYRQTLETLSKKCNLTEKVIFLGWIDNKSEKMKELYGKASIFVSPSYFESHGQTILEAAISKAIIIATNLDPFYEIIKDEIFLFPPKNINELQKIISYTLRNYNKISQSIDMNKYFWNTIIPLFKKLYY